MQDDQLIFMISLPRSGSTMLQKILGSHSDIYTRSEPWLMLHPLYALKSEGIQTRYNAQLAAAGVRDFLQELPVDSENYYYSRIRDCYLSLYAPYLNSNGKRLFLDKTPRYYEVFDELQKTFPRAKFIILYRHPLAILSSMLETWVKGRYENLKSYKFDLNEGIEFLKRDFTSINNTHTIRYEDLLLNPELETEALFNFLKLPNQPDCIEYGQHTFNRWMYGDPVTVYEKSRPDTQHATAWHAQLTKPEERRILSDYLLALGPTAFSRLGYNFEDTQKVIADAERQYASSQNESSISLSSLLLSDAERIKQVQHSNSTLRKDSAELRIRLKNLQAQLEVSETELGKSGAQIQELHNKIGACAAALGDRDRQIQVRDEQIQHRDAQIAERDIQLQRSNEYLISNTTALTARNVQLAKIEEELRATRNVLSQETHRTQELKSHLTSLLTAAKDLTSHHAYIRPLKKLRAYKALLNHINATRKSSPHSSQPDK